MRSGAHRGDSSIRRGVRRGTGRGRGFHSQQTDFTEQSSNNQQFLHGKRGRFHKRGGNNARGKKKPSHGKQNDRIDIGRMIDRFRFYHSHYSHLINLEREEEEKEINQRLSSWPMKRLLHEGYAILNCQAKTHGNFFGQTIVRIFNGTNPSDPLPQHRFSNGDMLTMSRRSMITNLDQVDIKGVVMLKTLKYIQIVVDSTPRDLRNVSWRIDHGSNQVAYERMSKALKYVTSTMFNGPDWLRNVLISSHHAQGTQQTSSIQNDVISTSNHHVIFDDTESEMDAATSSIHSETNSSCVNILSKLDTLPGDACNLNKSQRESIANALSHPFSLIQGPPGTGKTTTAVDLIRTWRSMNPTGGPVLVTAQTNVAVDQLLSRCIDHNLKSVRVGQPVKVAPELLDASLEAHIQRHPRYHEVLEAREEVSRRIQTLHTVSGRNKGLAHRDLSLLHKKVAQIQDEIDMEIVNSADVVCATCIGAGSELLARSTFRLIVLDEATQCTEPEAVVALARCRHDAQVVLIGDHQQLPPTVHSTEAANELTFSLFDRMICLHALVNANKQTGSMETRLRLQNQHRIDIESMSNSLKSILASKLSSSLLAIQYRMHPAIAQLPSLEFYDGQLQTCVDLSLRIPPAGFPWKTSVGIAKLVQDAQNHLCTTSDHYPEALASLSPVCFVQVGDCKDESRNKSKANVGEAEIVARVVHRLLQAKSTRSLQPVSPNEIGIITPYTAQVYVLQEKLRKAGIPLRASTFTEDPYASFYDDDEDEDTNNRKPRGVDIRSVDGFQGREKEVIIVSTVRSNAAGNVGFLSDFRRLNVAITRAKRGLIVIGNANTLMNDPYWKSWVEWSRDAGCILEQDKLVE